MPFIMTTRVDGGCRYNGYNNATGASAAIVYNRNNHPTIYTKPLISLPPHYLQPTSQRAELTVLILALEHVLLKHAGLKRSPRLRVTIYTDSRYAQNCLTTWYTTWLSNNWRNPVANRDLIEWAKGLEEMVKRLGRGKGGGRVKYVWVPREQNVAADRAVGRVLDGF